MNPASQEPLWISEPLARSIHQQQLMLHGGQDGVRDEGLFASALARPRQLHAYGDPPPDIFALAASYAFGLARNHAFLDGNKRAALVVSLTFLRLNQVRIDATQEEVYFTFLSLASGQITEDALAAWLREHGRPLAQ